MHATLSFCANYTLALDIKMFTCLHSEEEMVRLFLLNKSGMLAMLSLVPLDQVVVSGPPSKPAWPPSCPGSHILIHAATMCCCTSTKYELNMFASRLPYKALAGALRFSFLACYSAAIGSQVGLANLVQLWTGLTIVASYACRNLFQVERLLSST